jgi:IS5 family transposase
MRRGGETARSEGKLAYQKLVRAAQATIRQAEQVLPVLEAQATPECHKLAETLDTFIPRAKQVVDQTVRRVFEQEKVPAAEKMVSIFEPHTDIIRRNKAHKPTEYGHKIWLDEVEGGILTRWQVLEGNPSDEKQWLPSLDHHQARFGKPPDQASGDRGLYSPRNERIAAERGVKRVILPRPGKKSQARKQHERQPWFVRGRRWHAGVEGRISLLKRRFGLDRCLDHGAAGFEKWVGWAVIAANLTIIGKKVAANT